MQENSGTGCFWEELENKRTDFHLEHEIIEKALRNAIKSAIISAQDGTLTFVHDAIQHILLDLIRRERLRMTLYRKN